MDVTENQTENIPNEKPTNLIDYSHVDDGGKILTPGIKGWKRPTSVLVTVSHKDKNGVEHKIGAEIRYEKINQWKKYQTYFTLDGEDIFETRHLETFNGNDDKRDKAILSDLKKNLDLSGDHEGDADRIYDDIRKAMKLKNQEVKSLDPNVKIKVEEEAKQIKNADAEEYNRMQKDELKQDESEKAAIHTNIMEKDPFFKHDEFNDKYMYFSCNVPRGRRITHDGISVSKSVYDEHLDDYVTKWYPICTIRIMVTGRFTNELNQSIVELTYIDKTSTYDKKTDKPYKVIYTPISSVLGRGEFKQILRPRGIRIDDDELKPMIPFFNACINENEGDINSLFKTGRAYSRLGWKDNDDILKLVIGDEMYCLDTVLHQLT
jgi:hypothetical protein